MMLEEIVRKRAGTLEREMARVPLERVAVLAASAPPTRDFKGAVSVKGGPDAIRIIAEVKKASPSKGVIREAFDPLDIAKAYEANGACAVSVLTEEDYFQGSLEYLRLVRANVGLPVLRKDFIIGEYQVYEARAAGADALLLIAAILDDNKLSALIRLTEKLGMEALVEVHNEEELKAALFAGPRIIGVNNRDLKTFKVDIDTTKRLAPLVPKGLTVVSESGINTIEDIFSLKDSGVSAFLIGEALMRQRDVGKKLRSLCGPC